MSDAGPEPWTLDAGRWTLDSGNHMKCWTLQGWWKNVRTLHRSLSRTQDNGQDLRRTQYRLQDAAQYAGHCTGPTQDTGH